MAGNSILPNYEIPQSTTPTIAAPLDTRTTIDNNLVATLDAQVPVGVRYAGLMVYVNETFADALDAGSAVTDGGYYYFKPNYSLTGSDRFLPENVIFTKLETGGDVGNVSGSFDATLSNLFGDQPHTIIHNLGSDTITVSATIIDPVSNVAEPVDVGFEYDNTHISLTQPNDISSYLVNSRYHAIIIRSRVFIETLKISITN